MQTVFLSVRGTYCKYELGNDRKTERLDQSKIYTSAMNTNNVVILQTANNKFQIAILKFHSSLFALSFYVSYRVSLLTH